MGRDCYDLFGRGNNKDGTVRWVYTLLAGRNGTVRISICAWRDGNYKHRGGPGRYIHIFTSQRGGTDTLLDGTGRLLVILEAILAVLWRREVRLWLVLMMCRLRPYDGVRGAGDEHSAAGGSP